MSDDGVRCDRHVGEVFPPRCLDCEAEKSREATETAARSLGMRSPAELLAEIVREHVERSGLSVAAIASAVGIEIERLERQLAGEREFVLSELFRVAAVVGADPAEFVRRASEETDAARSINVELIMLGHG